MKNYSKKIVSLVAVLALFCTGISYGKVRAISTRRAFEQTLSTDSMVVALFYEATKEKGSARDQNKGLTRMYEDLSAYQPYDDADVIFLKINSDRKELGDLASLYDVKTVPTFIFFNKGKRLVDNQGAAVALHGFVSRQDLQSFIDMYYGAEIKKYVAVKNQAREQRVQEDSASWKAYFYPRDVFVRDYAPAETKRNLE